MIAAVADVGRPSVSIGTRTPAAEAVLAASGPAAPSIAPFPDPLGFEGSFFSAYELRKVGISARPAGMAPMGKPMAAPRSHGFHDRFHSSSVIQSEPESGMISSLPKR